MILTAQERQAFHDECQARFASPDTEARQVSGERVYVRTLGKRCPWCGDIFFGYQVEGEEEEPYRTDANPLLGIKGNPLNGVGTRSTCGHPKCHEVEDDYQFKRRVEMRAEHALNLHTAQPAQPSVRKL